jgi:hypothetical protein
MPYRDTTADITRTLHETLTTLRERPVREADLSRWRWQLRQRLAGLRDLLVEDPATRDGWLTARAATTHREREALLTKVGLLGPRVLGDADVEAVTADLTRLVGEVDRHFQRLNDLAYDEVELELGGSE